MKEFLIFGQEWFELNQKGYSLRKIGKLYGTTHKTVGRVFDFLKLSRINWYNNELINITNQKFGQITVINILNETDHNGKRYWLCYCSCNSNKQFKVISSDLRRGRKTHCGCNFPLKNDLSGQTFGYLTVVKDSGERSPLVMWQTKCTCGKTHPVSTSDLISGHTKSCGCKRPKGEEHYKWSGSSEIKLYLRGKLKEWKKDSLNYASYRCVISGEVGNRKDPLEVHHLFKSFSSIYHESLELCKLEEVSNIGEYTKEELDLLIHTLISKHYEYGLGVPIKRSLHLEYHHFFKKESPSGNFEEFLRLKRSELK
ncbi:hypothetical protein [Lysinibacillus sp. SGAir0095]|uniref:hypothetical protein n=1 Tax=Lysinibacillus sp. SGAir0095 TaxID=2070463 RepID=UPI0010CCDFA0|nr:hypothetical protein [Lysinibacillus sp. SGAir0095]QCR33579.1 hypothetical protein C1N55_16085 [Lysinibacillus sp. SGAir0095]